MSRVLVCLTRIAGIVTAVYVDQNDFVKGGQVLVDLDPRDYQIALEQARGQFGQAQRQAEAEQPHVPLTILTNQTTISVSRSEVNTAEQGVATAERNYQAAIHKLRASEANNTKALCRAVSPIGGKRRGSSGAV